MALPRLNGETKMRTVTKAEFEAFLAKTATLSETEVERGDAGYAYENWLNMEGNAVAFITYHDGDAISFHIADA